MTDNEFEQVIIKTLYANPDVSSKVVPELDNSWFINTDHKYIVDAIIDYNTKYSEMPNVIEVKRLLKASSSRARLSVMLMREMTATSLSARCLTMILSSHRSVLSAMHSCRPRTESFTPKDRNIPSTSTVRRMEICFSFSDSEETLTRPGAPNVL